ncbi:IS3 family transposase [Paenibacillus lentus]|uniref:helix-turn-helix domain-containing protein n=1 Tax=Paenibacillus lentus TaxID=1338368 RepID=UPI0036616BC4
MNTNLLLLIFHRIIRIPKTCYCKGSAVKDYLDGELSQNQIIEKYMIASRTQLADWIKKYNGHSSLKAYTGGTLKCEKYYLHTYRSFEELKKNIDDYIHFYNYERLQIKLNGLSPMEFRIKAA